MMIVLMKKINKALIFAVLAVTVLCPQCFANNAGKAKPMNVLFLVIDDLNTWLLSNPGRYTGRVIAPNIERLAESGVLFTRAYTASPKCSPSRTAFLMGVAPWESGHTDNGLSIKSNPVLAKATSFPKLFQQQGYYMVSSGKIGHGYDGGVDWDQNVKHKRDPAPPGAPLNGFAKAANGRVTERDWGTTHLKETEMNDTRVADCAVEALQMKHTKPFFIACGLFHPHMPWYVPQKYFDMYPLDKITLPPIKDDDLDDIPALGQKLISGTYEQALEHNQYEKGVQAYLAATTYADAQMGRVLVALENSPYKDNTVVVLLSDHGFHVGEKKHWQKGTLWEDGSNSLLMFRVPRVTKSNLVYERPVSLLDVYPTLTELTGLEKPDYVAGQSLVPILKDVTHTRATPVLTAYQDHVSVRTNQYRLIRYADGTMELYDHNKDRNEWDNQSQNPEYASIIKALGEHLPEFEMLPSARNKSD